MALAYRSSSAANGAGATVATLTPTLPTGWAANDLVYFIISIGINFTAPVDPTGWTVRYDTNSDSTGRTIVAYRTMQSGDSAPVFSWTTAGKWAYTGICIQPAAGQVATHSGIAVPTVNATATSHTSPAFAAGALTGMSVLLTGYRGGANVSTAITTTAPTNWTKPATNADTSTATGTTTALRQVAAWHAYRTGQTGTITPGAQTVSATAVANLYHIFAVETAPWLGPSFVRQSTVTSGTGATSATVTLSATPTAGNLLVLMMVGDKNTGTLTVDGGTGGWVQPTGLPLLSTSISLYAAHKVAVGNETSVSLAWTTTPPWTAEAWIGEYAQAGSGAWTLISDATHITDETNVTSWSSGTTGALSADGLAIAEFVIDTGPFSGTTLTNGFARRYEVSVGNSAVDGKPGLSIAERDSLSGETVSSTLTSTGPADQMSGAVFVFARVAGVAAVLPARARILAQAVSRASNW